jgi:hypothetical protein
MENVLDSTEQVRARSRKRINHVVVGLFLGFNAEGGPLVDFPDNPAGAAIVARSTLPLVKADEGRDAALLFENGDPARPIIVGRIQESRSARVEATAEVDDKILTFTAKEQIVLRCGDASITLTRAGKVLIRGTYVLSRSSGVNMVKGATIHLN